MTLTHVALLVLMLVALASAGSACICSAGSNARSGAIRR